MLGTTEKEWQRTVEKAARLLGWRVYHTLNSKGSEPGFPDLFLVRRPRLVVAELKTEKGRLSPAQREWLEDFMGCLAVEVHVWRPSDWRAVEETLK